MFLTPPDIISQTLLALPMWLLFEVGIFFSRGFLKRKEEFSKAAEDRYRKDDIGDPVDEAMADDAMADEANLKADDTGNPDNKS